MIRISIGQTSHDRDAHRVGIQTSHRMLCLARSPCPGMSCGTCRDMISHTISYTTSLAISCDFSQSLTRSCRLLNLIFGALCLTRLSPDTYLIPGAALQHLPHRGVRAFHRGAMPLTSNPGSSGYGPHLTPLTPRSIDSWRKSQPTTHGLDPSLSMAMTAQLWLAVGISSRLRHSAFVPQAWDPLPPSALHTCHAGMGQIASEDVTNLGFFSQSPPRTVPVPHVNTPPQPYNASKVWRLPNPNLT